MEIFEWLVKDKIKELEAKNKVKATALIKKKTVIYQQSLPTSKVQSRYIPADLKQKVWQRDQGQ